MGADRFSPDGSKEASNEQIDTGSGDGALDDFAANAGTMALAWEGFEVPQDQSARSLSRDGQATAMPRSRGFPLTLPIKLNILYSGPV